MSSSLVMDDVPLVTGVAVVVTSTDGVTVVRTEHPARSDFEMTTDYGMDLGADLGQLYRVRIPDPPRFRSEFTARRNCPIKFETVAAPASAEQIMEAYRKVTGLSFADVLSMAAAARAPQKIRSREASPGCCGNTRRSALP